MAIDITKGRKLSAKDQSGGIKNLYLANYGTFTFATPATTAGVLTSITPVATAKFFKYELKGNNNKLEEAGAHNRETGTTIFTQKISATLPKLSAEAQNELKLIGYGRPFAIVEDYNGNYKFCGLENGVELMTQNINSGGARTDLSGFTLEFQGEEKEASPFLSSGAVTTLLANISTSNITEITA